MFSSSQTQQNILQQYDKFLFSNCSVIYVLFMELFTLFYQFHIVVMLKGTNAVLRPINSILNENCTVSSQNFKIRFTNIFSLFFNK